jgi:serine/threonine protein phosphatase 1
MTNPKTLSTEWADNKGPIFDIPTFAIGDVHGQAGALERLLGHIDSLSLDDAEREIIFTGDLVDRGPESLRAIELAVEACDRFDVSTLLPGNHELMMMTCLMGEGRREDFSRWYDNGGKAVLNEVGPYEANNLDEAFKKIIDRLDTRFIDTIMRGPTHLIRNRTLFVHAGILPDENMQDFLSQSRFAPPHPMHWAWIRQPFLSWQGGWQDHGLDLVVHGHTPVTTRMIETTKDAAFLLDQVTDHSCICLDAGAMRVPQVVAVEFRGAEHRLHIAQT